MTNAPADKRGKLMPTTYAELVRLVPPRPIHSDAELAKATAVMDRLIGFDLNRDQEDYLDALSTFVAAYENKRFPIAAPDLPPTEILKVLLEEHGMSASDLGRLLGNRSLGPAILNGKRQLSKAHMRTLAEHFNLDPAALLEKPAPRRTQAGTGRRSKSAKGSSPQAKAAAARLIALGGGDPHAAAGRRRRSAPYP